MCAVPGLRPLAAGSAFAGLYSLSGFNPGDGSSGGSASPNRHSRGESGHSRSEQQARTRLRCVGGEDTGLETQEIAPTAEVPHVAVITQGNAIDALPVGQVAGESVE